IIKEIKNWENFLLKFLKDIFISDKTIFVFIKYLIVFSLFFITIAVAAILSIISVESNPFFYANF
ncbi:MAG TPA: hypothetical protein VN514_06800, partial [Ignavibacteria bacterium]|nr:hypothetical protein [Ignavibacteria bacterium]